MNNIINGGILIYAKYQKLSLKDTHLNENNNMGFLNRILLEKYKSSNQRIITKNIIDENVR